MQKNPCFVLVLNLLLSLRHVYFHIDQHYIIEKKYVKNVLREMIKKIL